jgi:RNA-binding protein YhbY
MLKLLADYIELRLIKQDLSSLLGVIGTTALACVTGGITTPALLSLAGGLSSVASNLLSEFSPGRMKKWFVDVHPDDLNHSLKKLFVHSIGEALSNISILYTESGASRQEKEVARKIIQKLQKELGTKMLDSNQIKLDEPEVKQFLYDRQDDDAIVSYVQDKFDAAGASPSFGQFLAQHLAPQIQLCYGEGLKNPANHDAWVTFQRMLAEDLQETANRIEQTQQKIKTGISELKQGTTGFSGTEMNEIRQLKEMLQNKKLMKVNISRNITKALTEALEKIEKKENELIRTTTETNLNVKDIKTIAIRMEKRQKQMTFIIVLSLAVTFIAAGALAFYLLNQPFTATVHVYGWEGTQHHLFYRNNNN